MLASNLVTFLRSLRIGQDSDAHCAKRKQIYFTLPSLTRYAK